MTSWQCLVRYVAKEDGETRYGQPIVDDAKADLLDLVSKSQLQVRVLDGDSMWSLTATDCSEMAASLLAPLAVTDVPFVRCIGLNYKTHILETRRPLPVCPTIFCKPGTTIAGPSEDIPIPKIAQYQCDYEGELVIIIGKDAKDVTEEQVLDHVAGYTVANDVSARDWQREPGKGRPRTSVELQQIL